MNCHTAHLLIEAFHDDELGVVEAATLLSHLDACPACARRHEAARRLKNVFREARPVVECPEALKRKLARRVEHTRRFPRAVPPSVTLFVLAAGIGLLVGEALPLRSVRTVAALPVSPVTETPVTQRITGQLFCLRCALERLFPGTSFPATPHRGVVRTADGRILTLLPGEPANVLPPGTCAGRPVRMVARVYPESGLVRVVSLETPASVPRLATPAATLARVQ